MSFIALALYLIVDIFRLTCVCFILEKLELEKGILILTILIKYLIRCQTKEYGISKNISPTR